MAKTATNLIPISVMAFVPDLVWANHPLQPPEAVDLASRLGLGRNVGLPSPRPCGREVSACLVGRETRWADRQCLEQV